MDIIMLTKVNPYNYYLGTSEIYKFNKKHTFDELQDNLNGQLLVKNKNNIYIYNYNNGKYYKHNKIQIEFNDYKFVKQIDSFDQNNFLIANKIRKYVLYQIENNIETILGIGGEFYVYFPFINAKNYIGISNHISIINDAKYNIPWSKNILIDYNKIELYPTIYNADYIILNLFNIHINVINFIKNINFKKLILITCNLHDNKFKILLESFNIMSIKYFKNISGLIRIIIFSKKNYFTK